MQTGGNCVLSEALHFCFRRKCFSSWLETIFLKKKKLLQNSICHVFITRWKIFLCDTNITLAGCGDRNITLLKGSFAENPDVTSLLSLLSVLVLLSGFCGRIIKKHTANVVFPSYSLHEPKYMSSCILSFLFTSCYEGKYNCKGRLMFCKQSPQHRARLLFTFQLWLFWKGASKV